MARHDNTRTDASRERTIERRASRCYKHGHTVTNGAGRVRRGTAYAYTPAAV